MPGNLLVDPVDFMRKNLVLPDHNSIGMTQAESGAKSLCLIPSNSVARHNGMNTPIFILRRYRGQGNVECTFQGFWCSYAQNATYTCKLDDRASLCFTATMDGCTFGAIPAAGHARCDVAHSNEATFAANRGAHFGHEGARQFQDMEQTNRVKHALGDGASTIKPSDYMYDHNNARILKSTTFGVRTGANWAFYTQTYTRPNNVFILRGVTQHI